jgi:hypothetical protein
MIQTWRSVLALLITVLDTLGPPYHYRLQACCRCQHEGRLVRQTSQKRWPSGTEVQGELYIDPITSDVLNFLFVG